MRRVKVRQRDISDCGAACLASISAFFRQRIPVAQIRMAAGTDKNGTTLLGLSRAAEKLGYKATGVRAGSSDLPAVPLPCIAHIRNEHTLHYVVLYRYGRKGLLVMDPAGASLKQWPIDSFLSRWTGVLLLIAPEERLERFPSASKLQRFIQLFHPHAAMILQALLGALVYTLLGFSMALFIQKLTDQVIPGQDLHLLKLMGGSMLLLILLQAIIGMLGEIYLLRTGQLIDHRLLMGYYRHLTQLSQQFFVAMQPGEIASRVGDAVKVRHLVNRVGVDLLVNVMILGFSFIFLAGYSWKLSLFVPALIPVYVIIYLAYNAGNKRTQRQLMEYSASFESRLLEYLSCARLARSFNLERFFRQRIGEPYGKGLAASYDSGCNAVYANGVAVFASQAGTVLALWSGARLVLGQEISMGQLMSFYAIIGYFSGPVIRLIQSNKEIQNALIAADRFYEILDLQILQEGRGSITDKVAGDLHLKKVNFSYPGQQQLFRQFDLYLERGNLYALVGPSGCGKSTLLDLVEAHYKPDQGGIFFGGHDLWDYDRYGLRETIASARHSDPLIEGSLMDNLLMDASRKLAGRARHTCSLLGMDPFIYGHPDGYNRQLGGNGGDLSAGQRQRVVLARLLIRNPSLYLLDEATSALDAEAEQLVITRLKQRAREGALVIFVTHRMRTVREADHVLLMEAGRVKARGDHQTLIKEEPLYARLCSEQQGILP